METFIEQLQLLNEPMKRKILFVSTGFIMGGVIFLWLGYFNGLITPTTQAEITESQLVSENNQTAIDNVQPSGDQQGAVVVTSNARNSIWQNMGRGLSNIAAEFFGFTRWMVITLQGPGQYSISPEGR